MASIHCSKSTVGSVGCLVLLSVIQNLMAPERSFQLLADDRLLPTQSLLTQVGAITNDQANDSDSAGVLSGKILDDLGQPVVGATITLMSTGPKRETSATTRTDNDGKYDFDVDILKGEYSLTIQSNRCVGLMRVSDQPRMVLSPDSSTVRDFHLQRCCLIKVRVVDENGNRVQNAQVRSVLLVDESPMDFWATKTKQDEWVDLYCPKSTRSKCLICAFHDDYAMETITQAVEDVDAVPRRTIFLKRGKTISGRVTCSDGKLASGWKLDILPTSWSYSFRPNSLTLKQDGTFSANNIGPGKYTISIQVPKGETQYQNQPLLTDMKLSELEKPLELQVDYPSPESLVSIVGTTEFDGAPPPNGFSLVAKSVDGKYMASTWVAVGSDYFRFANLPPGEYTISSRGPDLQDADLRGVLAPSDNVTFRLKSRNKIRLRGTVIDALTLKPVPRFLVRVTRPNVSGGSLYDGWVHVSGDKGQFDMGVEYEGEYKVFALAFGYGATASELINTAKRRDQEFTIQLKPEVPLSGIVVGENGTLITDATVIPMDLQPSNLGSSVGVPEVPFGSDSTQDGNFTLLNLSEGRHSIRVTHPSFCSANLANVELRRDANEPVRITLTSGARIKGTVFDDRGVPRSNVPLVATAEDPAIQGRSNPSEFLATTDKNGEYVIDHLPTGFVCVRLRNENLRRGVVRRTIAVENKGNYPFNLGGDNHLSGRLLMNGRPYVRQKLVLSDHSSLFGRTSTIIQTDDDGDFDVCGVPPGWWMLSHRLPGKENDWVGLREVEIPAVGDVNLGEIDQTTGSVIVRFHPDQIDRVKEHRLSLGIPRPVFPVVVRRMAWQGSEVQNPVQFDEVPFGDYELHCQRSKSVSYRTRVSVTSAAPNPVVNLRLPIGTARLHGRIEPAAINKLRSEILRLRSENDELSLSIRIDKDGSFKADGLPAATYHVHVGFLPNAPVIASVKLEDAELKMWDMKADMIPDDIVPTGQLLVKTFIPEGIPTPMNVTLKNGNRILESSGKTQMESRFYGPEAAYEMTATLAGFRTMTRQVEIKPWTPDGPTNQISIQLEP